VVDDQLGNPTSANDLAFEILKIATTDAYGIYHCTNKGVASWYDFACEIVDRQNIDCTKTPITSDKLSRPAKRPAFSSLKNARLENTLGDEMRDWKIALSDYLKRLPELENKLEDKPESTLEG
jgi:dTDP-4-dehydrorhamnose reductase